MDTKEIAVTFRVPRVLTLNSGVPECLENAQPIDERTMKEVKSLRLSQGSAMKGTCSQFEVVASYMLSSHAANVHGESSANFHTAIHQPQSAGSDLFDVHERCDAACSRDLGNDSGYT